MNDKIFLDTNILVYSYSYAEVEKQKIARELISENNSHISTQVLQELANTLIKKFKVSNTDVVNCLAECKNKLRFTSTLKLQFTKHVRFQLNTDFRFMIA